MAPIRIGIIGLAQGSWAASAHLPYLISPESKFQIVAVCNSSVESAKRAVKALKLDQNIKTYGNVQDIANDKDIDLVVCAVRVDRHFDTITPAIKAKKNVFVEWPLGKNLFEAQELAKLAKEHNVQLTAVGLQGRFESTVVTLKEILASGKIGKVLSSTLTGQGLTGGPTENEAHSYLIDRKIGGSLLTIPASHCLDFVRQVLGEYRSFQSILSNQRQIVEIVKDDGSVVDSKAKKTTHDHIMIQGAHQSGAVFSVSIRGGAPFKDAPGLEWSIYGEKGEIRVKGSNAHIQIFGASSIELHDFATDKVEKIEQKKGTFDQMHPTHRNLAREYEAIAAGDKSVICDFNGAVKRHEFIEKLYQQNPDS